MRGIYGVVEYYLSNTQAFEIRPTDLSFSLKAIAQSFLTNAKPINI